MKFTSLRQTVQFLEKQGELIQITQEVDPHLEMAEITRQVHDAKGPALLFTNVKNAGFPALSNMFGTYERTLKIFEPELQHVKALVDLRSDPFALLKTPGKSLGALKALAHAMPVRSSNAKVLKHQTGIDQLPMIKCWSGDGGGFVLLPQVFSKDPDNESIFKSNLGMYRIQMSGNAYEPNREIGLHYQLHRGIGIHHKKALEQNVALRVSIFIGGPPAHTLAAVMPLPEGVPEIAFAGALAGRNFRYTSKNGFFISNDADFCITGTVVPNKTKPEGPFGDHLGYYSLEHEYPYLKVESVWHRPGAIFPFTVVGRPPQEDSNFGRLIHEITRTAIADTLPGVTAVNAVDDAGVHPLLLAKAHERYLPYETRAPRELLTHANAIMGTGQLSLAKYLFICAHEDNPGLDVNDEKAFFIHMLERVDFASGLHFFTRTTMDTLDYSTSRINAGSKLVVAAAGPKKRKLATKFADDFSLAEGFFDPGFAAPGMVVVRGPKFDSYPSAKKQINNLKNHLQFQSGLESLPLFVVVDDAGFARKSFSNFLWVTFLRSNPSHDIYGVKEKMVFKHWGCAEPLIIDARIKPFHSPVLESDPATVEGVKRLAQKGGPLFNIL
ncbi:MAG: UbiD family decarboxylase [Desulfobacteraceae bacterium]|nr:UbiD family decarboxylase [Desulfobacteraceae bacterium]